MDQVFLITIILAAVVGANILARHVAAVPLPFFLIGFGVILSALPVYRNFRLDPSTFAFAIIAPLLYNEAQNSSRLWIGRSILNILSLAVGLVLVTVLIVGTGLHWFFAILPLSLSFALLAIVTPTDASAVNSIFEANPIAREQMGILKNESLFNDAAGIVIFDVALTAYISGTFSLQIAIGEFLWEFLGGLIFGAVIGILIVSIRLFLIRYHDDTPLIMVSIQLLSPFLVYLLAERLALSGILAVVAAGLAQGSERSRLRLTSARMQIVTSNVWEVIAGILSGSVFVLLGLSLPLVIQTRHHSTNPDFALYKLLLLALLIYFVKTLVRLVWSKYFVRLQNKQARSWRDSLVMALSGAHGTITLSLAFSMPNAINGQPFAFRGPLIFMAAVIILISMIMPTIFIPIILPAQKSTQPRYQWVRRMLQAGIRALTDESDHPAEAQIVIDTIQQQLILDNTPKIRLQRQLMKASQEVEKKAVKQLYDAKKITADELTYYYKFIQLNNFSADDKAWKNVLLRIRFSLHIGTMNRNLRQAQEAFLTAPVALEEVYWRRQFENHGENLLPIEQAGFEAVMAFLKTQPKAHEVEVNIVRRFYRTRHRRVHMGRVDADIVYQMFMRAFHAEYTLIQDAVMSGQIPSELAERLQQRISFDEITYIQNIEVFQR
ncbi:cation:proton antiporter [Agrilactobacillus fermenti]|uniref:cation:proton antiporter n=1 Tax=Agrilactobacillus fermenti TaxID=2586909 RepID=UPI001E427E81|nr:sodium:proton antiporter [Agrilactobacillus fermenti]MCD2255600.1 sodium:proton antiporter [Agrilactobacillus fermenti]